jgi:cytochrome c biogenesis protein CcdA
MTPHSSAGTSAVRGLAPWAATLLALAGAIGAARLAGPGGGGLALVVASVSARSADLLQGLGEALPLGYAFATGMAAAVNPCGFALLPAYLGLYLGTERRARTVAGTLARALLVGSVVTASFVGLFASAGLVLGAAASAAGIYLPWASLAAGGLLVVAGGRLLAGGALHLDPAARLAGHLGGRAARAGLLGYAAYGLAFALTSLGCTLPLVLVVGGSALTAGGVAAALRQFVLYALGMGAVLTALTLAAGLFGPALLRPARRAGRFLAPAGGFLLLATGAYVVFYWLSVGGLLWVWV